MRQNRIADPLTAVAYLRVSTDEQSLGLDAQRAAIAEWARRAGVEVVAELVDDGVGGGVVLSRRPGLIAAMAAVKAMRAGHLVVAKRDRLARDPMVSGHVEREVARMGCARVVSADGVANGDTPAEAFMRTVIDGVAKLEREMIGARTSAAMQVKRSRGETTGKAPYGKRVGPDGVHLEDCPAELAVMDAVARARADGMSVRATAAHLAELGVVNPRTGMPLSVPGVGRLSVMPRNQN